MDQNKKQNSDVAVPRTHEELQAPVRELDEQALLEAIGDTAVGARFALQIEYG